MTPYTMLLYMMHNVWSMNSYLVCACTVYQQKGETPLLTAVNEKEGSVVKYLIHQYKVDIRELDQVRYEYNRCS